MDGWKRAREGGLSDALGELPPLVDDEQFQEMLVDAISRMRNEILAAIDKVSGISQETLTLLKELVSESFTRPYLSEEAVASLEYSARVFDGMGDQTTMLYESARGLRGIEEHAWALHSSSGVVREIQEYVFPFLDAARDLNTTLSTHVDPLTDAADKLRRFADEYMGWLSQIASQLEAARLPDALSKVGQIAAAARQLNDAAENAPALAQAAEDMEAVAYGVERAAAQTARTARNWSWNSFRWGAAACLVAIAGLLALWTFAIK